MIALLSSAMKFHQYYSTPTFPSVQKHQANSAKYFHHPSILSTSHYQIIMSIKDSNLSCRDEASTQTALKTTFLYAKKD